MKTGILVPIGLIALFVLAGYSATTHGQNKSLPDPYRQLDGTYRIIKAKEDSSHGGHLNRPCDDAGDCNAFFVIRRKANRQWVLLISDDIFSKTQITLNPGVFDKERKRYFVLENDNVPLHTGSGVERHHICVVPQSTASGFVPRIFWANYHEDNSCADVAGYDRGAIHAL